MISRRSLPAALLAVSGLALVACSGTDGLAEVADVVDVAEVAEVADTADESTTSTDTSDSSGSGSSASASPATGSSVDLGGVGALASDAVHELTVEFDEDDYAAMIETYTTTGDKEWIEATVTIDGETYEQVGIRLKGNSSLRGLAGDGVAAGGSGGPSGDASAEDPASLPWLVKLDKYVDQSHDGLTDLVVRSNTTATALNEAVALELLELAGLASQDAIATSFSVNGSEPALRLVIEHPDDLWMDEWLGADGALYKAESTGDYSYRGDDPESYDEVFDQEAGEDNADLTPLMEFLEFVNESDDAAFAAELGDHLDVDAFATYLAMQELIDNFDDIDGPGNNSYLYYDTETGLFTVVPWDHNLAFGQGPGGAGGFPGGAARPAPGDLPAPGDEAPQDGGALDLGDLPEPGELTAPADGGLPDRNVPGERGGPGGFGGSNVLVDRFLAVDEFQTLYDARLDELRASLFDSGLADDLLTDWTSIVSSSGLVDSATVESESAAIAATWS